jgi:hypothetical protein
MVVIYLFLVFSFSLSYLSQMLHCKNSKAISSLQIPERKSYLRNCVEFSILFFKGFAEGLQFAPKVGQNTFFFIR